LARTEGAIAQPAELRLRLAIPACELGKLFTTFGGS
jgi:hypothetical protein